MPLKDSTRALDTTRLARVIFDAANHSVGNGAKRLTMATAETIARIAGETEREAGLMAPASGSTVGSGLRGLGPVEDALWRVAASGSDVTPATRRTA